MELQNIMGNEIFNQFKEEKDDRDHYIVKLIGRESRRLSQGQGEFIQTCLNRKEDWIKLQGWVFRANQITSLELIKVAPPKDLGVSRDDRSNAVTAFAKITPISEWLSDEVKNKIGIKTLGDKPTKKLSAETLNDWIGDKLFDCWRDFDTLFTHDFTLYLIDRMKTKDDKWHRDGSYIEQRPKNIDLEIVKLVHVSDDHALEIFISGSNDCGGSEKIMGNNIHALRVSVTGDSTAKVKYLIRKGELV